MQTGVCSISLFAQGQFESGWQNWGRKGKGLEKGFAPINSLWSCSCFCLFPVFVVSDAEYGEHIAHVMWSDVKQIEIWEICCLQCAVTSRSFGWFQFCSPKLAKLYGGRITWFYVHIHIYIHNICIQHIWLYHLTPYMDVVYIHIYICIIYIYACIYTWLQLEVEWCRAWFMLFGHCPSLKFGCQMTNSLFVSPEMVWSSNSQPRIPLSLMAV